MSCAVIGQSCIHEGDSRSIRGRTWCWGWWWMKQYCGFCQTGTCFLESPESSCRDLWLVRAVRVTVMVLKEESRKSEMTYESLFSGWVRASCSAEEMASAAQRFFSFEKGEKRATHFIFAADWKQGCQLQSGETVRTRSSSPSGQRMKRAQRNRSTKDCLIVREACKTCTWMQVFIQKVPLLCTCHVTFYDYATGSGNTGGNAKSGSLAWLLLNLCAVLQCCTLTNGSDMRSEKLVLFFSFLNLTRGCSPQRLTVEAPAVVAKGQLNRQHFENMSTTLPVTADSQEKATPGFALKSGRFDFCILQKTSVAQKDGSFQPR